jgi:hypothetical protein
MTPEVIVVFAIAALFLSGHRAARRVLPRPQPPRSGRRRARAADKWELRHPEAEGWHTIGYMTDEGIK